MRKAAIIADELATDLKRALVMQNIGFDEDLSGDDDDDEISLADIIPSDYNGEEAECECAKKKIKVLNVSRSARS